MDDRLKVRCKSCELMQLEDTTCHRCRKALQKPEVQIRVVENDSFSLGAAVLPMRDYEKKAVMLALQSTGNICRAGQLLEIGKTSLYRKLVEYGVSKSPKDWSNDTAVSADTNDLPNA